MKYTILAVTAAFCLGSASAALINVGNLVGGGDDTVVTDNAGNPIGDVHSFLSIDDLSGIGDFASLQASGAALLAGTNAFPGVPGMFTNAYNGADGTGQAIYLILSDNADLSQATQLGLVDTGQTLDPDGASPDSNSFTFAAGGAGTVLVGGFGGDVTADWSGIIGASNTGPSFRLDAIPEPSISLLAAMAGLGFLVRRKR